MSKFIHGHLIHRSLLALGLAANAACQAPPPPTTAARPQAASAPQVTSQRASGARVAPVAPSAAASAVARRAAMPVEPQGADPTPSAEDEASDASVVSEPPITTGFGPPEGSHAEFGMVKLSPTPTRTQSQRGALRMGQLRVRGGLPPEVVARVLRQNFGRWTACYERELAENPKLSGMVELKFGLDAQGAVQAPSVSASSLAAPRLQRCLVKDLRQLAFPAPSELPTEVTEQLHLEPRGQKPKNAEVPAND